MQQVTPRKTQGPPAQAAAPEARPGSAAPRASNYGYSEAGASWKKKALKSFKASSSSPQWDIDHNNDTLRQRARMLYMAAPVATSAIKTNRTNVIGCGLKLNSRIDAKRLGMSQEAAKEWQEKTEAEFKIWAEKKNACDATGVNDYYAMQQLALMSWLMSGDVFGLIKRVDPTPMCPYSLRIQLVEADRCSTPLINSGYYCFSTEGKAKNGNRIFDGVEIDDSGMIQAYYFRNTYPHIIAAAETEWTRVKAYGEKTGLPNVLHVMESERPEQYRGVTYLAQIIEPLLQMRRYTEGELMAALVESFFTAFVTTDTGADEMPFNEVNGSEVEPSDPDDYEMGPGTINVMKPGEDIKFAAPTRPASGFSAFIRALCEQCGAALEIPADLLLKSFNASYSASRAALLEAWKAFKMRREWFANDFCKPIYEIWLSEAVALGRIQAPGFFSDPLIRAAWLGSDWIGPSQGQLDPTKEIGAEILANQHGYSTHEQSTIRLNGGQWEANMNQLKRENEMIAEANGTTPEAQAEATQAIASLILQNSLKEDQQHAMESPSNKEIMCTAQYFGVSSENEGFDQQDGNELNSKGITTAVFWGGLWVLWGPHTAYYEYGSDGVARYIFDVNIRMLMYITNGFQRRHGTQIDSTMDLSLQQSILIDEQEELDSLKGRGALIGDPTVEFLETANPTSNLMNGDFVWDISATPTPPFKSGTARVSYTDEGFTAYFGGGE